MEEKDNKDLLTTTEEQEYTQELNQEQEQEQEQDVLSEKSGSKPGLLWPIISLVLAAALVFVLIKPPFVPTKSENVATVNGVAITKDKLYEAMLQGAGNETLTSLIDEELINQEAKKANITVTDAEIEEQMKNLGSEEELNMYLAQSGMTREQVKQGVGVNIKVTKLLEPQVSVTDEEIKTAFETYNDSFNTPEQVRASVILVATEEEATQVVKELKEGKDFAELAKTKSLDPLTKEQGGDTDFFARGEKEEAVEEAAFKLTVNEISGPVKTSEGYQVIKVTDRIEEKKATLEESKEEIRKGLTSQKVSEIAGSWMEELKSKSKITNTLTDNADTAQEEAAAE